LISFIVEKITGIVKFLQGIKTDLWYSSEGNEIARFEHEYPGLIQLTLKPELLTIQDPSSSQQVEMGLSGYTSCPYIQIGTEDEDRGELRIGNNIKANVDGIVQTKKDGDAETLASVTANDIYPGCGSLIHSLAKTADKEDVAEIGAYIDSQDHPGGAYMWLGEMVNQTNAYKVDIEASEQHTYLDLSTPTKDAIIYPDSIELNTIESDCINHTKLEQGALKLKSIDDGTATVRAELVGTQTDSHLKLNDFNLKNENQTDLKIQYGSDYIPISIDALNQAIKCIADMSFMSSGSSGFTFQYGGEAPSGFNVYSKSTFYGDLEVYGTVISQNGNIYNIKTRQVATDGTGAEQITLSPGVGISASGKEFNFTSSENPRDFIVVGGDAGLALGGESIHINTSGDSDYTAENIDIIATQLYLGAETIKIEGDLVNDQYEIMLLGGRC
jgi:hypothetical protein